MKIFLIITSIVILLDVIIIFSALGMSGKISREEEKKQD